MLYLFYKIKNKKYFNNKIIEDIEYMLNNYKNIEVLSKELTTDYVYTRIKYHNNIYEFKIDNSNRYKFVEYENKEVYIVLYMMILIIKHHLKEDFYFIDDSFRHFFNKNTELIISDYWDEAFCFLKKHLNMSYKFLRIIENDCNFYSYIVFTKDTINHIYLNKCDDYIFDCSQWEIKNMPINKAIIFKKNNKNFFFMVSGNKISKSIMIETFFYSALIDIVNKSQKDIFKKMIDITYQLYKITLPITISPEYTISYALDKIIYLYLDYINWNNIIELNKWCKINKLVSNIQYCSIKSERNTITFNECLSFSIIYNKNIFFNRKQYIIQNSSRESIMSILLLLFELHIENQNIYYGKTENIYLCHSYVIDKYKYPKEKNIYDSILKLITNLNTTFNPKDKVFKKYYIFPQLKYFKIKKDGSVEICFKDRCMLEKFKKILRHT